MYVHTHTHTIAQCIKYLASTGAHDTAIKEVPVSPFLIWPSIVQLLQLVQDDFGFFFIRIFVALTNLFIIAGADEEKGGGVVWVELGCSFVNRGVQGCLIEEVTRELKNVWVTSIVGYQGDSMALGHMIHVLVVEEESLQQGLVQTIVTSFGTKNQHCWPHLQIHVYAYKYKLAGLVRVCAYMVLEHGYYRVFTTSCNSKSEKYYHYYNRIGGCLECL